MAADVATLRFSGRALSLSTRVVQGMIARNAFEAAAAVAFWFFLSLVPLLVLAGFLLGQIARTRGVDVLIGPFLGVVPETAESILRSEVERLARAPSSSIAPVGVASYLWTSSAGLHNLMDVFETAAKATRRPWWKKRAIALGWVALGLATICALGLLIVRVDSTLRQGLQDGAPRVPGAVHRHDHARWAPRGEHVVVAALTLAAGMALLGGFYRYAVEAPRVARRSVWPGAFSAVALWLVVSWAFGAYVVSIADYALFYGSLAAVAVLLIWLYLTSLSIVVGAEINAQLVTPAQAPARGRVGANTRRSG